MASSRKLPDLVTDTRLRAELGESYTHYYTIQIDATSGKRPRRQWRKETWRRIRCVGEGASGAVWLEECETAEKRGQMQVVKVMRKSPHFDHYRELEAMAKFSQSTSKYEGLFVKSTGWHEDQGSIFIVMEYIKHGSLASHLKQPLPEDEAKHITAQVLEGLACLHENEFVHRDLKPENILVVSKGPEWWVKIGDFGFSKRATGDNTLQSIVGTRNYFAPEMLGLIRPDTARLSVTAALGDQWLAGLGPSSQAAGLSSWSASNKVAHLAPATDVSRSWHIDGSSGFHANELSDRTGYPLMSRLTVSEPNHATQLSASDTPSGDAAVSKSSNIPSAVTNTGDTRGSLHGKLRIFHEGGESFVENQEYMLRLPVAGRKAAFALYHEDTLASIKLLGLEYLCQGRYRTARSFLQAAADAQRQVLGPTHHHTLTGDYWISRVLFGEEEFEVAYDLLIKTAEIQKVILGPKHEETLRSLYLIGQIYYWWGQYEDAQTMLEQVVDDLKEIVAPDNWTPLVVLQSLGCCYYKQGKIKEAQGALQEAVKGIPRPMPMSGTALTFLQEIGHALYQGGHYLEAHAIFEQISEGRKKLLEPAGGDHLQYPPAFGPSARDQTDHEIERRDLLQEVLRNPLSPEIERLVFDQLYEIGKALYDRKDYKDAEAVMRQVLHGRREILGERYKDTLAAAHWLGRSLYEQEEYHEAKDVLLKTVQDQDLYLGSAHRNTLGTCVWLGHSYYLLADFEIARSFYARAAQGLKASLGIHDVDTLDCQHWLGRTYQKLEDFKAAEKVLLETLATSREVFGETHKTTLSVWFSCGLARYGRKHYNQALLDFRQVADERAKRLGERDTDTLDAFCWVAKTLYALKLFDPSEDFWRKVAEGRKQVLGAGSPETLDAIRGLALSLEKRGKRTEAAELHGQVYQGRREMLGSDDESTVESKREMEKCREKGDRKTFSFLGSRGLNLSSRSSHSQSTI
ncbi:hypothetical protein BJX61DRAFT_542702 [Aspergillus egyptiacus]|nr:hypothetical protein BJX61DRAFT_542702 [Aspergillus egyptiacus]